MFIHQILMQGPNHNQVPAAHQNVIKGKEPNYGRIVISKARRFRYGRKQIEKHQKYKHGWQDNTLQPHPHTQVICDERLWCHNRLPISF